MARNSSGVGGLAGQEELCHELAVGKICRQPLLGRHAPQAFIQVATRGIRQP
jgi:hypothetical protein